MNRIILRHWYKLKEVSIFKESKNLLKKENDVKIKYKNEIFGHPPSYYTQPFLLLVLWIINTSGIVHCSFHDSIFLIKSIKSEIVKLQLSR